MGSSEAEENGISLDRDEALIFIRQVLHVDLPGDFSSDPDDSDTLERIAKEFSRRFAFSTLPYLCLPRDRHHLPSAAEVKERDLRMLGGTCYNSNVFLHFLLKTLGFQIHFVMGKFNRAANQNHVFSVAHTPSGRIYLVDAGSNPTLLETLVDLNFLGETSIDYEASLWSIRFRKCHPSESDNAFMQVNLELSSRIKIDQHRNFLNMDAKYVDAPGKRF